VRVILSISILLAAIGTILKLLSIMLGKVNSLEAGSLAVTFIGMGVAIVMIEVLFIMAIRYRRGQRIPSWAESFVSREDLPEEQ